MGKRTAALFVLYHPKEEDLRSIREIGGKFDLFFVFDNTPERDANRSAVPGGRYFSDGTNHGLAWCYNRGLEIAQKEGVEWLALFDQDSRLDGLDAMMDAIRDAGEKDAMFVPFIQYAKGDEPKTQANEPAQWEINSGSFLRVPLIREAGITYDEYYFLDRLDRDFCRQVTNKGLRITRVNRTVLRQRLGEQVKGANVHSPQRNYYMARNRLYYNHKFFSGTKRIFYDTTQTARHMIGVLRDRVQVRENIRMIFRGIDDYRKGISGQKVLKN